MKKDQGLDSEHRAKLVPSKEYRAILEEKTDEYERQFWDDERAIKYWTEVRGLSLDVASALRIGYVSRPLPGDSWFSDCLVIPYLTSSGVVSLKFRSLNGGEKYRYLKGSIQRIYNTPVLTTARKVVITEGEIDCISMVEAGLQAVAFPGASVWQPAWRRIFHNREVTIFCDGDEPGKEFGNHLAERLWGARIIEAPEGEDANSILVSQGAEELRRMVLG